MGNTKASDPFSSAIHQGKILEKLIAERNLTPFMMAKRLNISKTIFKGILNSETLTSGDITNICSLLNVETSLFFPASKAPIAEIPESKITKKQESKSEELQQRFQECLVNLLQAKDEIITQQRAYIAIQKEMIDLLKAPK